jgi:hypothetical protein
MVVKTQKNLKASTDRKSSDGEMVLAEPSKKGKKGKGVRASKRGGETAGDGAEDFSLCSGYCWGTLTCSPPSLKISYNWHDP